MPGDARAHGRLEIGRLGAPHGLAGELKIKLHSGGDSALFEVKKVWVVTASGEEREFAVARAHPSGPGAIVRFEGVRDRNAADELRGARVFVPRDALPPLAPGQYYLVDLIGASVRGPEGPVGEVVDVIVHPSVNSISVRLADGRIAEQPLAEPWVGRVSIGERVVELTTLDGLLV